MKSESLKLKNGLMVLLYSKSLNLFDDPYDLEHQVLEKLTERDFQPEADIIADKLFRKT